MRGNSDITECHRDKMEVLALRERELNLVFMSMNITIIMTIDR